VPIRPEELSRLAKHVGVLIAEDRPCRKCGYNLVGLKTDGKCPECGQSIHEKKRGPRFQDQMIDAPIGWLKGFRRGASFLMMGGWLMSCALVAWAYLRQPACGFAALAGAALWSAGAILATPPRPRGKASLDDPAREWRILRLCARWSQPLWCAGIAFAIGEYFSDAVSPPLIWLSTFCLITALIGCWPLLIIQSNLAYWASDTDLANRLRHSAWGLGIGLGLGCGVSYAIGDHVAGSMIGDVLIFAAWAGPILVSLGYVLLSLWQLWRMASWIMLNRATASMRDDRLRARATNARAPVKPL
jgi:hypothetical protein